MKIHYISFWQSVEDINADQDMEPKQKQAAVALLELGTLDAVDGGYPKEAAIIGDHLIIAGASGDGQPDLSVCAIYDWLAAPSVLAKELLEGGDEW